MRSTLLKLFSAALALVLLTGLGGCGGRKPAFSDGSAALAYVPLDDRPDNVERAEYLAESLDYELRMPDVDLYAPKLDGQPRNANGTQSGDRAALYECCLLYTSQFHSAVYAIRHFMTIPFASLPGTKGHETKWPYCACFSVAL